MIRRVPEVAKNVSFFVNSFPPTVNKVSSLKIELNHSGVLPSETRFLGS